MLPTTDTFTHSHIKPLSIKGDDEGFKTEAQSSSPTIRACLEAEG